MTTIPPPRYRIVERGRRLEVIDTLVDRSITARPVDPDARQRRALPSLPRQTRFDGSAELTTSPLYDNRGPRLVKLDAVAARQFGLMRAGVVASVVACLAAAVWQPWLMATPLILLTDGTRKPLRAAITRWLDRVADGTL